MTIRYRILLRLSRSGEPVVVEERIKLVGNLLELYRAGMPLGESKLNASEAQAPLLICVSGGTPWLSTAPGANLASSERQHGDDFLLLAAHELVDLYAHSGTATLRPFALRGILLTVLCLCLWTLAGSGEIAYLLYSLALLEQGLKVSQYNFQMRLLAMRIYARLGRICYAARHDLHVAKAGLPND